MKTEDGMWGEESKMASVGLEIELFANCLLGYLLVVHVQMERPCHTSTAYETLKNLKTACTELSYRQYHEKYSLIL
jgi:hypothetical protein